MIPGKTMRRTFRSADSHGTEIVLVCTVESDYRMTFAAHRVCGETTEGVELFPGKDWGLVENMEESATIAHGSIKWDGCSDFDVGSGCSYMNHYCSAKDAEVVGHAISEAYRRAAELIPAWDGN